MSLSAYRCSVMTDQDTNDSGDTESHTEPGWLKLSLTDEQVEGMIEDGEDVTFEYDEYTITVGVEGLDGKPLEQVCTGIPTDVCLKVHPHLAKQAVNTDHVPSYPSIDERVQFTVSGTPTNTTSAQTGGDEHTQPNGASI